MPLEHYPDLARNPNRPGWRDWREFGATRRAKTAAGHSASVTRKVRRIDCTDAVKMFSPMQRDANDDNHCHL